MLGDRPVVIYSNHPSWWDPLVGLIVLSEYFPHRRVYAPIDAAMLMKYQMFKRMGFFGVEKDTAKGAAQFISMADRVLRQPSSLLAVTAQGRFADVRERPLRLKRGLAHLIKANPRTVFVPAAIEYVFWEEKLPEILVRIGVPRSFESLTTIESCHETLERDLERTQDDLAHLSIARDEQAFTPVLSGRSGMGGVYDLWRKVKAMMTGGRFNTELQSK